MKQSTYIEIISLLKSKRHPDQASFLQAVSNSQPNVRISDGTLVSIYSQEFQRHIKQIFSKHHKPRAVQEYFKRFMSKFESSNDAGILVTLAEEIDFPPVLVTRIILEEYLKREMFQERNVPKGYITQILKTPALIGDERLAKEIQLSIDADENCGPLVDAKKHQIGQHYEDVLREALNERQIPFRDEHYLRQHGYDKTPDYKLEVPFAVDGNVVNWVESKALFGDEEGHTTYLEDQYWGYCNRFGPGMVIYWFGFIDELDTHRSRGIVLMDKFPDNIVTLDSLL